MCYDYHIYLIIALTATCKPSDIFYYLIPEIMLNAIKLWSAAN